MINRDLIEIFIELAREKNIERSELGTIIEQLFLFIIEKETGESDNCSVIVNLDKGEIESIYKLFFSISKKRQDNYK